MEEAYLLALAFGLGLLGFVEPCSLGAHGIFLGQIREKGRSARLRKTLKGIALLGGAVFSVQKGFWLALGLLYLALGIAIILNARFRWGLFGSFSLSSLLPKRADRSLGLGVVSGLNLPACAVPLMLALLGRSAASGAAWGFASLFVFGLALSLPLVPLVLSERAAKLLRRLTRLGGATGVKSVW
jgi:cytochrome c-type biogenesis protein